MNRIKRICRYLKLAWRDEDWDHGFLLEVIALKLKMMEEFWESDKPVVKRHGSTLHQIKQCRILCERIIGDRDLLTDKQKNYFLQDRWDLDYLTKMFKKHLFTWWD